MWRQNRNLIDDMIGPPGGHDRPGGPVVAGNGGPTGWLACATTRVFSRRAIQRLSEPGLFEEVLRHQQASHCPRGSFPQAPGLVGGQDLGEADLAHPMRRSSVSFDCSLRANGGTLWPPPLAGLVRADTLRPGATAFTIAPSFPQSPRNPAPKAEPMPDGIAPEGSNSRLPCRTCSPPCSPQDYRAIGALPGPWRPAPGCGVLAHQQPRPPLLRPAAGWRRPSTNWPPPDSTPSIPNGLSRERRSTQRFCTIEPGPASRPIASVRPGSVTISQARPIAGP